MTAPHSLAYADSHANGRTASVQMQFASAYEENHSMPNQRRGIEMGKESGLKRRSVHGREAPNTSRVSTDELVDFMKTQTLARTVKEVTRLTGLSEKAVANIRSGLAGASAQTISTWCRNDPQFRAEYFYWCGGYVESDPEFIAGITMALNSLQRRKGP